MDLKKNYAEVLIDGKIYTIGGAEDIGYIQKVADHVNRKQMELRSQPGFAKQKDDYQIVMLEINLADDYFKAKKQISLLEEELQGKEKELYNLKHELIAAQIKLENTEKNIKGLQKEVNESAKKIVRLETELKK